MNNNSFFYLRCKCSCGIAVFHFYDDQDYINTDEICMGVEYYAGVNNQVFSWYNLKERIKASWNILMGKYYELYDLILDKKDFEEFRKWLNSK
jgi:hypothetical protein